MFRYNLLDQTTLCLGKYRHMHLIKNNKKNIFARTEEGSE